MAETPSSAPHRTTSTVLRAAHTDGEDAPARLLAAYAVLHGVHYRAAALLDAATALLTVPYASASSSSGGVSSASSSPLLPRNAETRRDVEDLLLGLTNMQAELTAAAADGEGDGEAEQPTVNEALTLLLRCLPSGWPSVPPLQPQQQRGDQEVSAAPDTLTCPSDVVQLALLLRRHWTLQRDLTLCIPALLSLLADDAEASLLSMAVSLAIPQLSHATEALESQGRTAAHQEQQQRISPTDVISALPALLWRAWQKREHNAGYTNGAAHSATSAAAAPADDGTEADDLVAASAAAAAQGSATARQLTKRLYKWEAHVASYATAQLTPERGSEQNTSSPPSKRTLMTEGDAAFLNAVVEELNVLRGACDSAQLIWLTLLAALHPLPQAPPTASADVLRDVAKRCAKLEGTVRPLLTTTALAQWLLPGVLLWRGCSMPRRPLTGNSGGSGAQQRSGEAVACWREAHALSQRLLCATHPLVEELAALLRTHSCGTHEQQQQRMAPRPHMEGEVPRVAWAAAAAAGSSRSATNSAPPSISQDVPQRLTSQSPSPPPPSRTAPNLAATPRGATLPPVPLLSRLPSPPHTAPPQRLHPSPPPLPPPQQQQQQPRLPDTTRAFATAVSARRPAPSQQQQQQQMRSARLPPHTLHPVQRSGSGLAPHSAAALRQNTFPPPPSAAAEEQAGQGSAAAAVPSATPPAAPPQLTAPAKTRGGGFAALRNCHRLANPADALKLVSAVSDAVFEDDLAHKAAMARRHGRRKKKKNKSQRNTVASTEALLLSAAAEDSTTSTNGASSASNADESRYQQQSRSRQRRRRRPDRVLLPPLTDALVPAAAAANGDVPALPPDPLSPFADGGDPFWSASLHDDDDDGVPRPAESASRTAMGSARESVATLKSGGGTQKGASRTGHQSSRNGGVDGAAKDDAAAAESGEEEEDEEEEYDSETLPERNARLQREMRTYYAQLNERRVQAAAVIQRGWRCSQARKILRTRQQMLYRYVFIVQKAAALAIEGFVLGVWEQRRRRAALAKRAADNAKRQLLEQRQVSAAQVLTRAARQWGRRQRERRRLREQLNLERDARLRLYEVTAVVVQRWWRTMQPRKVYWRRRHAEVAAQRAAQAAADRLDNAATVIQKRMRGVQARARVAAVRRQRAAEAHTLRLRRDAAVTVLTTVLQEHVRRVARVAREAQERQERQEDAALRIAESWRAALERRRVELAVQRARQLRTAATRIQRAWRRHIAGRQRRYLRQTRRTLQEERLERELCVWTSVVQLQCAARGAADVVLVRRLKARAGRSFMESLILIQAVARGGQAREALGEALLVEKARQRAEALAAQQRRVRAVSLLQATLRARTSARAVQQRHRTQLTERLLVYSAVAREMKEDAAAAIVQRAVRRYLRRQHTAAADAEAALALDYLHGTARRVQQAWRAHAARCERRRRAAAVARCAAKRQEREEVTELIWRDQKREMVMLHTLEQHYIAEAEHAARVALYRSWLHPTAPPVVTKAPDGGGAAVEGWAALYVD